MRLQLAGQTRSKSPPSGADLTSLSHPYLLRKKITKGGYFLLCYHIFADIFPLGSAMLCVVRTFLRLFATNGDETTDCKRKGKIFSG